MKRKLAAVLTVFATIILLTGNVLADSHHTMFWFKTPWTKPSPTKKQQVLNEAIANETRRKGGFGKNQNNFYGDSFYDVQNNVDKMWSLNEFGNFDQTTINAYGSTVEVMDQNTQDNSNLSQQGAINAPHQGGVQGGNSFGSR